MVAELTSRTLEDDSTVMPPGCPICAETDPAPLIPALLAGNMVASFVLKCLDFAFRARLHIVLASKRFEFSVTYISAANSSMGDGAAAHAYLLPAGAGCVPSEAAASPNIIETTVPWAPAQVRIQVHVNVHLKSNVLLEDILGPELLHVPFVKFNITSVLHAGNLHDLPVHNVRF